MKLKELWQALYIGARGVALAALAERSDYAVRMSAAADRAGASGAAPEMRIRFNAWRLSLIFFVICVVAVTGVNALFALALSQSVSREGLQRDQELMIKYIEGIAQIEELEAGIDARATLGQLLDDRVDPTRFGVSHEEAAVPRAEFLGHMLTLPDTLRVNLIGRDRTIFWSSDPARIGRRNDMNTQLEEVFTTRKPVTDGYWNAKREEQKDSVGHHHDHFFVESYIPLFDTRGEVASVVEVYREPGSIIANVDKVRHLVWIGTTGATVFVCLALLLIMRSFDRLIRTQLQRRIENERLILVGEMSAAVAHGLRSPMAAIRSSAELALEGEPEQTRHNARDIIARVDQLNVWLRDLLTFSQPVGGETEALHLSDVLHDSLRAFHTQFEKTGVRLECTVVGNSLPPVAGNGKLILQVLNSVIANALEAMPRGGLLRVAGEVAGRRVRLVIGDSGVGMSEQQLEKLFKPFHTTKRNGLGLGMTLAKRVMENAGGSIQVRSRENEGTVVELNFEAAR